MNEENVRNSEMRIQELTTTIAAQKEEYERRIKSLEDAHLQLLLENRNLKSSGRTADLNMDGALQPGVPTGYAHDPVPPNKKVIVNITGGVNHLYGKIQDRSVANANYFHIWILFC